MSDIRLLVEMAISRFGTESKLAAAAGVSQPSINAAKRNGRVGPRVALGIDRATRGEVSKHDLRPDLWPREDGEVIWISRPFPP
jgi:DNA-binding transcriptional regulator YdaS (Cro superfamily)